MEESKSKSDGVKERELLDSLLSSSEAASTTFSAGVDSSESSIELEGEMVQDLIWMKVGHHFQMWV